MNKALILTTTFAAAALLALTLSPHEVEASRTCARKSFKTQLVADACRAGGQNEAKKAMKKFLSQAKKKNAAVKNCRSCHSALSPSYPLTGNGLSLYQQSGGR